jgi:hypothetical protein
MQRGMRVLDICCGPGMLAAGASERDAEAIGLDFAADDRRDRATLGGDRRFSTSQAALGGQANAGVAQSQSRLAKDFEASVESAVAWLLIASIKMLTRRLARA